MRKMIVVFAVALFVAGCDQRVVNSEPTVIRDSVVKNVKYSFKTVVKKTTVRVPSNIVSRDTVVNKYENNVILGKTIDKESKKAVGIVVCSDVMRTCSKTNSSGVYRLEKKTNLFAGRLMEVGGIDTTITPENVSLVIPKDTTIDTSFNKDSVSISDTISFTDSIKTSDSTILIVDTVVIIDSIKSIDSSEIVVTINLPDTVGVKDTLTYVNNGTVMGEIPIDSWGSILPENYIVQRDISAIDSTWDVCIKTVEAVYFLRGDSVAKVVTLGKVGKDFTGFIYTLYNDSSYRKDEKIYNLFLRGKNDSGKVVVKTEVEMFSEKFGDIPTKILRTKVGVREYEIVPKFVPAAKNNEKLKDSEKKFAEKIDSVDWIGIDAMPNFFQKTSSGIYGWGEFVSVGIDSVSFDIETDADSINIPQSAFNTTYNKMWIVTIPNNQTHYKVKIDYTNNQDFWIHTFDGSPCVISNVRFYYKKK